MEVIQKYRICIHCKRSGGVFYARKRNGVIMVGNVCILCHRDRMRSSNYSWVEKNRPKINKKNREWRKRNYEYVLRLKREWYRKKDIERMSKYVS